MNSQGETQMRAILGSSLSNTRLLIFFAIFGVATLIAISIQDNNLKICFWLSLILCIVCLINLNLSLSFYIKLRNDKGVQGPRGERGDKGPKGFPGRCELNVNQGTDDNIKHCKTKIINNLMKTCKNYEEITKKSNTNRTPEETQKFDIYTSWINKLDGKCKTTNLEEDDFFNEIFNDSSKYCLV